MLAHAARSQVAKSALTILLVAGLAGASFYWGMWVERGRPRTEAPAVEQAAVPFTTERSEDTPHLSKPEPRVVLPPAPAKSLAKAQQQPSQTQQSQPKSQQAPQATPVMGRPVTGDVLVGYEWTYSPAFGDWRFHTGVDLKADTGSPVKAALAGTVTGIKTDPTNGTVVTIDHSSGFSTSYAGLDGTGISIAVGDKVVRNQVLGRIGDPALVEVELGPHLHFEVKRNGSAENPAKYIPR